MEGKQKEKKTVPNTLNNPAAVNFDYQHGPAVYK